MPRIVPIPWKRFEKFLIYIGCEFEREEGDHRIYSRPGLPRPIIVPRYRSLPVFIIKNNVRTLGMSTKQYLEIIEKV